MSQNFHFTDNNDQPKNHLTTRRGFITTLSFGVVSLYGLWAAYGAAPTSLSFLTEGMGEGGGHTMGSGGGSGPTPAAFRRMTEAFIEAFELPDGTVKPTRQAMATLTELKAAQAMLREAGAERARLGVLDGELSILKYRKAELNAKRDYQKLDLSDRTIKSPIDGVVDKIFVKPGEYVTPGQRLALVHDPEKIWIQANIKETQIGKLKIGQPVELIIDAYPDIPFEGRVLSVGNATTSEFALLPSPNPSGNFTKITQRLPVRIAIQQKDGLLRPGMMVEVSIDIRNP